MDQYRPASSELIAQGRASRRRLAKRLKLLANNLHTRLVIPVDVGDWRPGSRAERLCAAEWTRTYLWLHPWVMWRHLYAAAVLADSKMPTTVSLPLRQVLESATWFSWTFSPDDDQVVHARALAQAAREDAHGTSRLDAEVFDVGATGRLRASAEELGLPVAEMTLEDGRRVIDRVAGERRPRLTKAMEAHLPDQVGNFSSLSALSHGEGWRVAHGGFMALADGGIAQVPDELLALALPGVLRAALQTLDGGLSLLGIRVERQPWRASLESLVVPSP